MGTPFANNSRRDHLVPAGITDSTMTSLLRAITCPEVGERIFTARLVGALTRLQETMNTVMRTKTAVTDSKIHFFMKYLYIVNPKPSLKVPFSGQPVSRILSRVRIYLDNLSPDCSSGLPGDQTSRAGSFSCLTLHRMGVAWPRLLPKRRWSLTPPFHPCSYERYVSVARSESLRLPRGYLASCSMVYGLSSLIQRAHLVDLSNLMIPLRCWRLVNVFSRGATCGK